MLVGNHYNILKLLFELNLCLLTLSKNCINETQTTNTSDLRRKSQTRNVNVITQQDGVIEKFLDVKYFLLFLLTE